MICQLARFSLYFMWVHVFMFFSISIVLFLFDLDNHTGFVLPLCMLNKTRLKQKHAYTIIEVFWDNFLCGLLETELRWYIVHKYSNPLIKGVCIWQIQQLITRHNALYRSGIIKTEGELGLLHMLHLWCNIINTIEVKPFRTDFQRQKNGSIFLEEKWSRVLQFPSFPMKNMKIKFRTNSIPYIHRDDNNDINLRLQNQIKNMKDNVSW